MDDRYLRVFHAICQAQTMSAAAMALHLSQSTLSYQLGQLEQSLGVALFERQGRRLVLTPAGRRMRDFCDRHFSEYRQLRAELQQAQPDALRLRIAAVSVFGRNILVPHLLALAAEGVQVELSFPVAIDVFHRVLGGAVNLGFVHFKPVMAGLAYRVVHREEYVMIRARGKVRRPAPASWDESAFVTYEECDYLIARWYQRCLDQPPPPYRSVAHMEEMEEVVRWVAAGHGVAIVPSSCLGPAHAEDVETRQTVRKCPNDVYAVWSASGSPDPHVTGLIRRVRDAARAG